MRVILTQGRYALVDDIDAEAVGKLNWQFERNRKNHAIVYARTKIGFDSLRLTAYLLGPNAHVIFTNGNMLDHRRSNMQVVDGHGLKRYYTIKHKPTSNTGHLNIYQTGHACWMVRIGLGHKRLEEGGISTLGQAIQIRDRLLTEKGLPLPPMPKSRGKKTPVTII